MNSDDFIDPGFKYSKQVQRVLRYIKNFKTYKGMIGLNNHALMIDDLITVKNVLEHASRNIRIICEDGEEVEIKSLGNFTIKEEACKIIKK
jgi:hypothetical protein